MAVTLSGVLTGPNNQALPGVTIKLVALETSRFVVKTTADSVETDAEGRYSLSVPSGLYEVRLEAYGVRPELPGTIRVYDDSAPGTLNTFLNAPKTAPSPEWVSLIRDERVKAEAAALAAKASEDAAAGSASAASTSKKAAKASQDAAAGSASAASASQTAASSSASSAASSKNSAQQSKNAAANSASQASESASAASASKNAAKASEDAAAESASTANTAKNAAKASQDAAAESASAASASQDAAASSASSAASSKDSAQQSKNAAANSASQASESASAASASKNAAKASEDAAAGSASAANTAKNAAKASENAAAESAGAAAQAEQGATSQADRAEAEANKAQAAADAVGLAPFAMSKEEFKALQEMEIRSRPGSGFAEPGKHQTRYKVINEGLFENPNTANLLWLGSFGDSTDGGTSRTNEAIAVVDGVKHHIESVRENSRYCSILFPPAPDGTKTYDSATGVVTQHASAAEAFEGLKVNGDGRNGTAGYGKYNGVATITNESGVIWSKGSSGWNGLGCDLKANIVPGKQYTLSATVHHSVSGSRDINLSGLGGDVVVGNVPTGSTITYTFTASNTANRVSLYIKYTNDFGLSNVEFRPATEQVITSRKDLVFLETWHEKISEKGVVFPFGNVQYGSNTWEGYKLKTITDYSIEQGYSAFGEWDTTTKGYCNLLATMSDEHIKKYISDPRNNIYFDPETNELIQVRYRIRVIEGLTDSWVGLASSGSLHSSLSCTPRKDANFAVFAQAGSVTSSGLRSGDWDSWYTNTKYGDADFKNGERNDAGLFKPRYAGKFNHVAYEGIVSAIPIALVQRLNQGAYHPVYNPMGCAYPKNPIDAATNPTSRGGKWYSEDAVTFGSIGDCFNFDVGGYAALNTGNIASKWSGRSNQYAFYDAIYAGLVEDLRLSANNQDTNKLLEDSIRKAVRGEMRGKGKVPFLKKFQGSAAKKSLYYSTGSTRFRIYLAAHSSSTYASNIEANMLDAGTRSEIVYMLDNGEYIHGIVTKSAMEITMLATDVITMTSGFLAALTNTEGNYYDYTGASFVSGVDGLTSEFDSLPWVDISGPPDRIAETFPNGVVGQWIAFDYTQATGAFPFNRKNASSKASYGYTYTADNGKTWTHASIEGDAIANKTVEHTSINVRVALIAYETLSNFTEAADNASIIGELGKVYSTMNSQINAGNRLHPSLTGNAGKVGGGINPSQPTVAMQSYELFYNNGSKTYPFNTIVDYSPQMHQALPLTAPVNDSRAVKMLYTLTEKDGLLYLQCHYSELVYTAGSANPWGDTVPGTEYTLPHGLVPVKNRDSTDVDLNGVTVKVGCHHSLIPLGIASHHDSAQA